MEILPIRHLCERVRGCALRLNPLARGYFNLTGCAISFWTVVRAHALQSNRAHFLAAYGAGKLTGQRRANDSHQQFSLPRDDHAPDHSGGTALHIPAREKKQRYPGSARLGVAWQRGALGAHPDLGLCYQPRAALATHQQAPLDGRASDHAFAVEQHVHALKECLFSPSFGGYSSCPVRARHAGNHRGRKPLYCPIDKQGLRSTRRHIFPRVTGPTEDRRTTTNCIRRSDGLYHGLSEQPPVGSCRV